MSKRNELPALIATLLITAGLIGGGAWWLINQMEERGVVVVQPDTGQQPINRAQTPLAGADGSSGKSILPGTVSEAKQNGLDALAARDYATAKAEFEAALEENRNDPESLIYLSNAKIGDDQAYVIAASVPAGAVIDPALEMLRGVAKAQLDINAAGGIDGTPLKVLLIDDEGSAEKAKEIAAELVADTDVLGVVGHFSSDTTLAAAEVYQSDGLTMISPTSTAVKITDAGDYIFRTVPSDRLASATLARYVINELNQQKAAVFYSSGSTYSRSVKSEFTTELLSNGGEVVTEFDIDEPGFSAGRAVQEAKAEGAKVIMLALTVATVDTSIQIINVNQGDLPLVGSDGLYNPKVLDVGRRNALGLTVAVPWHILSHEQSPFVTESRNLWGGDVSWRTATAYDATKALAAAIGEDPTRVGVQAALSTSGFNVEGATDPVKFFPSSGDRNQPSQLVKVVPGKAAGGEYVYEPVQ